MTAIRQSKMTVLGGLAAVIGFFVGLIPGAIAFVSGLQGDLMGLVMFLAGLRSGAYWVCPSCGNRLTAQTARLCAVCGAVLG